MNILDIAKKVGASIFKNVAPGGPIILDEIPRQAPSLQEGGGCQSLVKTISKKN
jgi:hypothetical protein